MLVQHELISPNVGTMGQYFPNVLLIINGGDIFAITLKYGTVRQLRHDGRSVFRIQFSKCIKPQKIDTIMNKTKCYRENRHLLNPMPAHYYTMMPFCQAAITGLVKFGSYWFLLISHYWLGLKSQNACSHGMRRLCLSNILPTKIVPKRWVMEIIERIIKGREQWMILITTGGFSFLALLGSLSPIFEINATSTVLIV